MCNGAQCLCVSVKLACKTLNKDSIRDARTPQPMEIVFNTKRYRRSETVKRSGDFQVQIRFK